MSTRSATKKRPPDHVVKPQHTASDPAVSAWASANAGSGKTHVLTQRVIKLLLRGEDPAKILCITFTKAAAANMATRVFNTLSAWTALDDEGLDDEIRSIGLIPDDSLRTRARRLFALALETPGGLKVQTIHAFCTSLLHQFPFEADVGAAFEVLDDTTQTQMLERITLEVLLEGADRPDSAIGQALADAIKAAADQTFRELVTEAVAKRDAIESWIARTGSVDAAIAELSVALGISDAESAQALEDEILSGGIDPARWPAIAAALATGKTADKEQGRRFLAAAQSTGPSRIECYVSIFCKASNAGLLGRSCRKDIVTGDIKNSDPALAELLNREKERIGALLERLRAAQCRDRTRALITVAHEVIARYRREKARRGLLDYDDLIDRTLALFARSSAAWVLYKLDLGINHLLIDEAQDTSPKQWEIVRTLVSEFTAGAGARAAKRTIFAVGDDKQSIFSFQGAAPEKFGEMQKAFKKDFEAAQLEWRDVKLHTSFRSGEIILQAVDIVFSRQQAYDGLSSDKTSTVHAALPDKLPGHVDVWPLVLPDTKNDIEGWDAPFDQTSEQSQQVKLAKKIAAHVKLWQAAGTRPGDVLILVRQRGPLFEAIIRALKAENVAVAGADRMILLDHIAVMDLIALADALLLPQDDLALASALKSPLFGLSEDDLFAIAHDRGPHSLRQALFGKAADYAEATARLTALTDAALRDSPFTFYARLLGAHGGRKRMLERLGPEASDALDEFLNLALDYERRETPTLQGFVAWLRAAKAEVKRDMEIARNEVRVMTVHGAKGLEAHTVILADTTTRPEGYKPPRLLDVPLGSNGGLVWAKSKDTDPPLVAAAKEAAKEAGIAEYKRLLYVAMTRAEQRLVICGTAPTVKKDGEPSIPDGCWYRLVTDALCGEAAPTVEIPSEDQDGTMIRRLCKDVHVPAGPRQDEPARSEAPMPDWIAIPAAAETQRPLTIRPSEADDAEWRPGGGESERKQALERGLLLHRLIQSLPDIPPEHRAAAAQDYLRRNRRYLTEHDCAAVAAEALALLGDARFAALFAPGSRAEVPLTGTLPREGGAPYAVTGQIDRLAITDREVLIADYKTNRSPPQGLDAVPRSYRRQLALYRALLQRIYPGRTVRAILIWTETATPTELPPEALDAELATLTPG
ncbi:double-strand break repair helicase AddA [Pseudorhodoplanes sp.]|uniref:double-strand break repair helicase AddA n=1 Tax=Pseudorhodoplanes sp. TaxID=1934341 RepID=UPI00391ACFF5